MNCLFSRAVVIGVLVLVGLSAMGSATNLPGAVLARQEKTVTGSYYGSANTARRASCSSTS